MSSEFGLRTPKTPWVCPNDRQLALRAKLKAGWSVKTSQFNQYPKPSPLTEKEQQAIVSVIQKAEELELNEQHRVGKLVDRLESLRRLANGNGVTACILCGDSFGLSVFGRTNYTCADCKKGVCRKCVVDMSVPGTNTSGSSGSGSSGGSGASPQPQKDSVLRLCKLCAENREFLKKSGAWFYKGVPKYVLPEKKSQYNNSYENISPTGGSYQEQKYMSRYIRGGLSAAASSGGGANKRAGGIFWAKNLSKASQSEHEYESSSGDELGPGFGQAFVKKPTASSASASVSSSAGATGSDRLDTASSSTSASSGPITTSSTNTNTNTTTSTMTKTSKNLNSTSNPNPSPTPTNGKVSGKKSILKRLTSDSKSSQSVEDNGSTNIHHLHTEISSDVQSNSNPNQNPSFNLNSNSISHNSSPRLPPVPPRRHKQQQQQQAQSSSSSSSFERVENPSAFSFSSSSDGTLRSSSSSSASNPNTSNTNVHVNIMSTSSSSMIHPHPHSHPPGSPMMMNPTAHSYNDNNARSSGSGSGSGSSDSYSSSMRMTTTNTTEPHDFGLGTLEVSLLYEDKEQALHCSIHKAKDLTPMDANGLSDPYCMLKLVPTRFEGTYLRTKTVHKTLHPVFNETLTFYGVTANDIHTQALQINVMDEDRWGRDCFHGDCLGTCQISLHRIRPQQTRMFTLSLEKGRLDEKWGRGRLLLSLTYVTERSLLLVGIIKAEELRGPSRTSDPFVKVKLLHDSSNTGTSFSVSRKFKTSVKWKTVNPEFSEEFSLKVSMMDLPKTGLAIAVFDRDLGNNYLGGVFLNANSKGERLKHWTEMMQIHNIAHVRWHTLSPSALPQ